jgi:hypothetical protein
MSQRRDSGEDRCIAQRTAHTTVTVPLPGRALFFSGTSMPGTGATRGLRTSAHLQRNRRGRNQEGQQTNK